VDVFVDVAAPVMEDESTVDDLCRTLRVSSARSLTESAATGPVQYFINSLDVHLHGTVCELPERTGHRPGLYHCMSLADEAELVLRHADAYRDRRVGVLVPTTELVDKFRDLLSASSRPVQWYTFRGAPTANERISSTEPGVKVLTWVSALGMEFDTVIAAGLDQGLHNQNSAVLLANLQLLAATARCELFLSYSGPGEPSFLDSLPMQCLDVGLPFPDDISWPIEDDPAYPDGFGLNAGTSRLEDKQSSLALARALIETDRSDHRLRRRVLTAAEEVGLMFLVRGEQYQIDEELPKGFRAGLAPDDERAAAFDAMVSHNEGLVWSVIRHIRHVLVEDEDLYQDGVLGLMRAIEKFDAGQGTKFSTYATHWIRQAAQRSVDDKDSLIRIPVHVREDMRKVIAARGRLLDQRGEASVATISQACGVEPHKVARYLRLSVGVVSLDASPTAEDSDRTLADMLALTDHQVLSPDKALDRRVSNELIRQALELLPDRQSTVLKLRLGLDDGGEGKTLEEIGVEFGVSRERIRQIEAKAKDQIKPILQRLWQYDETTPSVGTNTSARPQRPTPQPSRTRTAFRRELASGADLFDILRTSHRQLSIADLMRQVVNYAVEAGARHVSVRASGQNVEPWLTVVHDGSSVLDDFLRTTLVTKPLADEHSAADQRVTASAVGASIVLFDELLSWRQPEQNGPVTGLALVNGRRTNNWWFQQTTEKPPATTGFQGRWRSVVTLRAWRRRSTAIDFSRAVATAGIELALVYGEMLRSQQLSLVVCDEKLSWRDPFLWRNSASQDLGVELVTGDGHSATVSPRVLPHPDALREEDSWSAGDVADWVRTQGFYVRCEGRYLSWEGWLDLEGIDCAASSALARVEVTIDPGEKDAWFAGDADTVRPPEALRQRLVALAMLARTRSGQVLARQPVPWLTGKD
jgi:RNA polymerase sigma factor (sigma-70 family)